MDLLLDPRFRAGCNYELGWGVAEVVEMTIALDLLLLERNRSAGDGWGMAVVGGKLVSEVWEMRRRVRDRRCSVPAWELGWYRMEGELTGVREEEEWWSFL